MRKLFMVTIVSLLTAAVAVGSHVPGAGEIVRYDGTLPAGAPVSGQIGFGSNPIDGYDWYCFNVTTGTAVTITITRVSGDIVPNVGIIDGLLENEVALGGATVVDHTENASATSTTFTFTPTTTGPVTMWVSTFLNELDGTYTVTMNGGAAGSCTGAGEEPPVLPPPPVELTAGNLEIPNGESDSVVVTSAINSGFDSPLTLSVEGLPPGMTATFSPEVINAPGNGTSTLTFTVGDDVFPRTWYIAVRGSSDDGQVFYTTVAITIPCDSPFLLDDPADQPMSQTVAAGGRAVLTVAVERGTAPLRYQWFMGARGIRSAPVRGVNAPTMTTPPINTPTDFWVEVSNPCGTARSWTAKVTPEGGNGKLIKRRARVNP